MIKTRKIVRPEELLELSRDRSISKVEIRVRRNSTLTQDVIGCTIYHKIFDNHEFVQIQSQIKSALLRTTRSKEYPQHVKEQAGAFYSHYQSGDMVWLSINKWNKMLEFEKENNINLSLPKKFKKLINKMTI